MPTQLVVYLARTTVDMRAVPARSDRTFCLAALQYLQPAAPVTSSSKRGRVDA